MSRVPGGAGAGAERPLLLSSPSPRPTLCATGNILESVTVLPRSHLGITQGALKKVKFAQPVLLSRLSVDL